MGPNPSYPDGNELNQYVSSMRKLVAASAASVVIMRNDQMIHEFYEGNHDQAPNSRAVDAKSQFNVGSIRKTYLGLAVSLALQEGKITSINDDVTDYLEELDEKVMRHTTIRHLLTHTHGLQGNHNRLFQPGTAWKYNNTGVNMLIRIVQKVFDQSLMQVLKERVFEPYGFQETGWRKEKTDELVWLDESYSGEQGGEANLFVTTRELAYWGHIHLNKGKVKGQQILPRSVFERSVSIITPSSLDESSPRNGFFWWVQDRPRPLSELGNDLPEGSYQSLGFYGNAVLVIPACNVVAVRMLNQTGPNPPGFDYIQDIQTFGSLVLGFTSGTL